MAQHKTFKSRTFITHLNLVKWSKEKIGFNIDGSKMKIPKSQQNKPPQKASKSKVDQKREQLLENVEFLIKYVIRIRQFGYVCQTEKQNLLGIRVINQFYVDENGASFSDAQ